ncbi:hypothetical protein CTEN210_06362 [Chaetoceros tenuissimus]|nr:hypothetical protein CTEN210_06362 [Chaetoceros tenuissimus]
MKHKVGGGDARGGLLMIDPYDNREWNALQWLVTENGDLKKLNVLKELRRSGLLLKEDIREYNLLHYSCYDSIIWYLIAWDPDALIETRIGDKPLIHYTANEKYLQLAYHSLHLFLKAGFKYHPEIGGLLFVKDDSGIIVIDKICKEIGETKTMEILHDILSATRDYPILHHVFIKAPKHKDLFAEKFPWAYHLKDHNGRTLHQALLAEGPEVMKDHRMLFASLTDNQIQTKDPVTTLYPFATMAVGEHVDLDKCLYLLRRQPSVLERRSRTENNRRRNKRKIYADSHGTQI